MGEGRPLVIVTAWPFCHLEAEWWIPTLRLWHERMAEGMRLVRYDARGSGLSQREVDDLSPEARLLDLEAVADHLALDTLDLCGYGNGGQIAVAYAVRHPDRVAHLVLSDSFARSSDFLQAPRHHRVGVDQGPADKRPPLILSRAQRSGAGVKRRPSRLPATSARIAGQGLRTHAARSRPGQRT